MTEQEAIELLKKAVPICPMSQAKYNQFIDAVNMGMEALEKQIAKKPKNIDEDMNIFDCPCCGHTILAIDDMSIHQNCLMCGQKLDWSEI